MARRSRGAARGDLFAPPEWDGARWDGVPLPDDPDGARQAGEEEARLVERLVARDERAFNALVRAYERRVFALVLRMIGNRAEAEDLAQEVFVQVFKAIGSFRGESKLSTWIYRIAINLCKNRAKYLRVRHAGEQDELEALAERVPMGEGKHANVAAHRPTRRADGGQAGRAHRAAGHPPARADLPRVPGAARRGRSELRRDRGHHRASRKGPSRAASTARAPS